MHYIIFVLLIASSLGATEDETKEIVNICTSSLLSSLPPSFCWKKGGDAGIIPKACPQGFKRKAALCEENCRSGYKLIASVCYKNCRPGYKDHGLSCYKNFGKWHFKSSYIPKRLTNFDKKVKCPGKMYHSGALCYRDCNVIGLVNCGIGACAISKEACGNKIGEIIKTVLTGGIANIGKLMTNIGSFDKINKNVLGEGLKKLGMDNVNNIYSNIKNVLTLGKNHIHKEAFNKAQNLFNTNNILKHLGLKSEKVCAPIVEKIEDTVNKFGIPTQDDLVNVFDIFKAVEVGVNCKGKDPVKCAKDVINVFQQKDPTGLLTVAMAFMEPSCNVPVQ